MYMEAVPESAGSQDRSEMRRLESAISRMAVIIVFHSKFAIADFDYKLKKMLYSASRIVTPLIQRSNSLSWRFLAVTKRWVIK